MNAKAIARLDLENGLHRVVESDELTRRSGDAGLESAVEVRNIVATLSGSAN